MNEVMGLSNRTPQLPALRRSPEVRASEDETNENSAVIRSFLFILAVPFLGVGVAGGVWALGKQEGGLDDLLSRIQLLRMNAELGYDDPMRYAQILGPWVAIILSALVLCMMIAKSSGRAEGTLGAASRRAAQREKMRQLGF